MTDDEKYKQFDPNPGEVWSCSSWDMNNKEDEPTVYYFIERLPPTLPSARFGSSHHTWRVLILEAGSLENLSPGAPSGAVVMRQFDGVSTGYGPPGREHDEGWSSYDNCYRRLA